jgi:uncharacterized damage-inducible protein DinB
MSLNQSFIAELRMEAANTRKMLERVPVEKNDWKPHQKSMKLGRLATHVAELPTWISTTMTTDELDLSNMDYKSVMAATNDELTAKHDANIAKAIETLENATPDDFNKMWTLRNGEQVIFSMPKKVVLRSIAFNHMIHHRGQLSVFLRLLDIPVPGMYGPSADEMPAPAELEASAN